MVLQNLFIAFLGITSVIASQPYSATNVCIEALLTKPGNAKDFCIQYLLLGTIHVPSFASPCLSTSPSDQQLFKSCYEILTQLAKEVPLPTALHFDEIEEPSKRGESLARDGGLFNTGSVPSVSTNAGIYENVGCFEDGVRGKPLGSPLLNLTGSPAETIQSCANACSISGRNGIPYLYAGVEPGVCWCSNYISILSIKSSSFCQSSCPSAFGKYCGGTVGGILYMQVYELKNWSGNGNPTSTTSVKTISSSLLKSSLTSLSRTFTSSSKLLTSTTPKTTSTQKFASVSVQKSISSSSLVRSPVVSAVSSTITTRRLSSSLPNTFRSASTALSSSPVKVGSTSSSSSNRLSILTTSSIRVSSASVVVPSLSPSGNSTSSSSSLTTSQVLISRSSSISTIISTLPNISQPITSASTVSESFIASKTPFISLSLTAASSATIHSFGLPPDPPTIPPIVGPTGTESYILTSGSFAYPSEVLATVKLNPWASLSLKKPDYYTQIDSDAVPGDPLYTPTLLLPPANLVVTSPTTLIINNLNTISSSSSTSSNLLPPASPPPDSSTIHVSTTTSPSPSTSSPSLNPTNPWAGLSLEEPDYYTQVPSDAVPGYVEPTTTLAIIVSETSSTTTSLPLPQFKKSKREYDIYAPDSPWVSIISLNSPETVKEIPPGHVPGWEQQAIVPPSDKFKREYDINAPDSPSASLLPLSYSKIVKEVAPGQVPGWSQEPVSRAKREYDITAPNSPWLSLLPLSRPEIIKEVPPDQAPGWQGQPSAPLIPDSDVPPKAKPKGKLNRRQIGAIPDNALEPPGRPDFIKEFPEKNNNKPPPPPFDKMKDPHDPQTGKKIDKKKPKYSHSKISLKKRPSLKDMGLQQDGREINSQDQIGKGVSQKRIKDHRYRHKLHLQGTPKAYSEMEEEMARRQRREVKNTVEEWEKKIFGGFGKAKEDWDEIDPLLREDAIIGKVLLDDEGDGDDEEENWIWRKWSGGKTSGGRKIQLEKV